MAIPDFQTIMRPIMDALSTREAMTLAEMRAHVADVLTVSAEEQQVLLPSGRQTTFTNRVNWSVTHMTQAQLMERLSRGTYALTDRGRAVLEHNSDRVDMSVLNAFAEYRAFRSRTRSRSEAPAAPVVVDEVSPIEAVANLVAEADDALAAETLARVLAQPPVFLEILALRLLRAMGYGTQEAGLGHTGQPGDAGLDGIVRQDALGLDLVGVQAKRYDPDNPVQRPALQAFVGALQGAQTSRGVFVTTGRFTEGARQFARSVAMQLVLIDGLELGRLMVHYHVGVEVSETFELKRIDEEFFETA